MKIFTTLITLLTWSFISYGQIDFHNGTKSIGFGHIGVVATGNNYQSGHFQNPALLGRALYRSDVFASYQGSNISLLGIDNYEMTIGGMINIDDKQTGGIALSYRRFSDGNLTNISSTLLPINYAYNLLKTDWAGISIGAGTNIIYNNYNTFNIGTGGTTTIVRNVLNFSGNLGVDAYRILSVGDNQFLRLNGAISTTTAQYPSGHASLFETNSLIRAGSMVSWKYITSNSDNFNINFAYQLNKELAVPAYSSISPTTSHHLGLEARYAFEELNISVAVRGGTYWNPTIGDSPSQYRTLGSSVYFNNIYIDAALILRSGGLSIYNPYNIGLGYQVIL